MYSYGMVQSEPRTSFDNTHLDAVAGKRVGEGAGNSGGKVAGSQRRAKRTRPQPELVPIVEEEEDSGGESRRAKRVKMPVKVELRRGQDVMTERGPGSSEWGLSR
jgi:hypothetical protein